MIDQSGDGIGDFPNLKDNNFNRADYIDSFPYLKLDKREKNSNYGLLEELLASQEQARRLLVEQFVESYVKLRQDQSAQYEIALFNQGKMPSYEGPYIKRSLSNADYELVLQELQSITEQIVSSEYNPNKSQHQ